METVTEMTDERLAKTSAAIYSLLLAARTDPTLRKWAQTANDGFEFLRAELAATKAENERLRTSEERLVEAAFSTWDHLRTIHCVECVRCKERILAARALNPEPAP